MMFRYVGLLAAAAMCVLGCGGNVDGPDGMTRDGVGYCPASGCDNASCIGAQEGARCVGFTTSEDRGWGGYCLSGICTEYVPVVCYIKQPAMTERGCDGSGTVTGGHRIDFEYLGAAESCSGIAGEFGYCAPGSSCQVYDGDTLIGLGVCQ